MAKLKVIFETPGGLVNRYVQINRNDTNYLSHNPLKGESNKSVLAYFVKDLVEITEVVSVNLFRALVETGPYKEGKTKASWHIGIGGVPAFSSLPKQERPLNEISAENQSFRRLKNFKINMRDLGKSIWIRNSYESPYIDILHEKGYYDWVSSIMSQPIETWTKSGGVSLSTQLSRKPKRYVRKQYKK